MTEGGTVNENFVIPVKEMDSSLAAKPGSVQCSGRWSAGSEWDRFLFNFPYLSNTPTLNIGFAKIKMIITARWYSAFRANYQTDNHAIFGGVQSPTTAFPNRRYYEAAVVFRPDRYQLLKVGYG